MSIMSKHNKMLAGLVPSTDTQKIFYWKWYLKGERCGGILGNTISLLQGGKQSCIPWIKLTLSSDVSNEMVMHTPQQVSCLSKLTACLWGTNICANSILHCHLFCKSLAALWLKTLESVQIFKVPRKQSLLCVLSSPDFFMSINDTKLLVPWMHQLTSFPLFCSLDSVQFHVCAFFDLNILHGCWLTLPASLSLRTM